MTRDRLGLRAAGSRRRALGVAVALMAPLASLGAASAALAKEPTGDFAAFKQCPRFTAGVKQCIDGQTIGGEIAIGGLTVPIKNPAILQGGVSIDEETGAETFLGALNGETLSRTPQPVPGGLFGVISPSHLPRSLQRILGGYRARRLFDVTATLELAQPEAIVINELNLIEQTGVALTLPVKIRLDNPFLGRRCYIGSNSNPIVLNLTDGATSPPAPNQPITGKFGEIEIKDEGDFIAVNNNTLVDNAFATPAASGCGEGYSSFLVDRLIDSKIGLPSAAGHNTDIQDGTLDLAAAETVVASEK